jgi:predicted  nucleic acid-binding Zn-ribbon protein
MTKSKSQILSEIAELDQQYRDAQDLMKRAPSMPIKAALQKELQHMEKQSDVLAAQLRKAP